MAGKTAGQGFAASRTLHCGSHRPAQEPPSRSEDLVKPVPRILYTGHCGLRLPLVKNCCPPSPDSASCWGKSCPLSLSSSFRDPPSIACLLCHTPRGRPHMFPQCLPLGSKPTTACSLCLRVYTCMCERVYGLSMVHTCVHCSLPDRSYRPLRPGPSMVPPPPLLPSQTALHERPAAHHSLPRSVLHAHVHIADSWSRTGAPSR